MKAAIPRELKRRAFVTLAERKQKFKAWLENQLESWLQQVAAEKSGNGQAKREERAETALAAAATGGEAALVAGEPGP